MPQIIVRKRRTAPPEPHQPPNEAYFKQMRSLLDEPEHKVTCVHECASPCVHCHVVVGFCVTSM